MAAFVFLHPVWDGMGVESGLYRVLLRLLRFACFSILLALLIVFQASAQTAHSSSGPVEFGTVSSASTSAVISVSFTFDSGGSNVPASVLTGGASNLDFKDTGTGSLATQGLSHLYNAGDTVTVNVIFKPKAVGSRNGAVVLKNGSGNVLATTYLHGTGTGPQLVYNGKIVSVGSGLYYPNSVATDDNGNVYIVDGNNHTLKETRQADGSFVQSEVLSGSYPDAVAIDGAGYVYIVDDAGERVSKGILQGNGSYSWSKVVDNTCYCNLYGLTGVAVDGSGNVYVTNTVPSGFGAMISRFMDGSYSVSTPTAYIPFSGVTNPSGVAVDGNGYLYVSDLDNNTVIKTRAGSFTQTTVDSYYLNRPYGIAVDGSGIVYVADTYNNQIVKETPQADGSYIRSTEYSGGLRFPHGVAVDSGRNVYIADGNNHRVLKIDISEPLSYSFATTAVGSTSSDSPQPLVLTNIGDAPLTFPVPSSGGNPSISAGFSLNASSTCPVLASGSSSPGTLAPGASCTLLINFTPTAVGSYNGSLVLTDDNASGTTQTISLSGTATQGTPVVSWTPPSAITYGAALSSAELNATAAVPGTFAYNPTFGTILPVGASQTLSVTFTPTDTVNYTSTTVTVTLTVNKAPLTITANNRSKSYGQTTIFTGVEFTTSGLQNSETIGSVTLTSAGAPATAGVAGSPYSITASAATGGTFNPNNYTITYYNGTLTVSTAGLTITANSRSKTYGQAVTFTGTEFTTSGLQNSETIGRVTLNSMGAASTAGVAGSPYFITASAATGGTFSASNYVITYTNGTLTVSTAALTITATNRPKAYGQTVTFTGGEFTASGLQNNETIGSVTLTSTGAGATAGVAGSPYVIAPSAATGGTFNPNNYAITYNNGVLTINSVALTIAANNASKIYGQTVTFTGAEFTAVGLTNGETVGSVTLTSAGAPVTAGVASSPYPITPNAATGGTFNPGNYAITYNNGSLTITAAPMTVVAHNASKTYGQTTTFTGTEFTTSGLQNGETVGSVSLISTGAAPPAGVASSPYPITPSAATGGTFNAANYTITYNNGALTVSTAALTITANSRSKTYGQTLAFTGAEFTSSGLQNGETIGNVTLNSAGAAPTAGVAGSPYSITTNAASGGTFSVSNYATTYSSGVMTVGPAPLNITAKNASKTYGQTITFTGAEFTATGLANGETIGSVTLNSAGAVPTAGVAGSPYAIASGAATGGMFNLGNYTITYNNGTLTVSPAGLTVTATAKSKVYGAADPALTYTITSGALVNGDTLSGALNRVTGESVGIYAIQQGTLTASNNYALTYGPADFTITLKALVAKANDATMIYGTSLPQMNGTLTGVVAGDDITASYSSTATPTSAAGSYPINPSLNDPNNKLVNYSITLTAGTLTIDKATATAALQSSAAAVLLKNTVTFTAKVTSSTIGTPTGSVEFHDDATLLGSATMDHSGIATLALSNLPAGSHSITAIYGGDNDFLGTTSPAFSETVQDFHFIVNGTAVTDASGTVLSATVFPGGVAVYQFQVAPTNGTTFPAALLLSLSGLPTGATYTISPASISAGSGVQTVVVQVQTTTTISDSRSPAGRSPLFALGLLPAVMGIVQLCQASRNRKHGVAILLLLLIVIGLLSMSSCSGKSGFFNQTPASYGLQLNASSGPLQHSVTLGLTIQ